MSNFLGSVQVKNRVWRFWQEPTGLTLRRRKTGHIPSRHNSYSTSPKVMWKREFTFFTTVQLERYNSPINTFLQKGKL